MTLSRLLQRLQPQTITKSLPLQAWRLCRHRFPTTNQSYNAHATITTSSHPPLALKRDLNILWFACGAVALSAGASGSIYSSEIRKLRYRVSTLEAAQSR